MASNKLKQQTLTQIWGQNATTFTQIWIPNANNITQKQQTLTQIWSLDTNNITEKQDNNSEHNQQENIIQWKKLLNGDPSVKPKKKKKKMQKNKNITQNIVLCNTCHTFPSNEQCKLCNVI